MTLFVHEMRIFILAIASPTYIEWRKKKINEFRLIEKLRVSFMAQSGPRSNETFEYKTDDIKAPKLRQPMPNNRSLSRLHCRPTEHIITFTFNWKMVASAIDRMFNGSWAFYFA